MTNLNSRQPREIMELYSRICDGLATPEELDELALAASVDERVRLLYMEYMANHEGLENLIRRDEEEALSPETISSRVDFSAVFAAPRELSESASTTVERTVPNLSQSFSSHFDWLAALIARAIDWHRHPVRFAGTAAVLTILMWIGWAAIVLPPQDVLAKQDQRVVDGAPKFVAQYLYGLDAVWRDDSLALLDGSHLRKNQRLRLSRGKAQIQFGCGAEVTLVGPAELRITGDRAGELVRGQMTARVPDQAHGFAITTPCARIVDLGTRFTVEVTDDGLSKVLVLEGCVEVALTDSPATRLELAAGDAAVASHKELLPVAVEPRTLAAARDQTPLARQLVPLLNGGFEDVSVVLESKSNHGTSSPEMNVWQQFAADPGVLAADRRTAMPFAGQYFAQFTGEPTGGSGIVQMIPTTVGRRYQIKFQLGRLGSGGPPTLSLDAFSSDTGGSDASNSRGNLLSKSYLANVRPGSWQRHDAQFTATSDATILRFHEKASSSSKNAAPLLDSVHVISLPSSSDDRSAGSRRTTVD